MDANEAVEKIIALIDKGSLDDHMAELVEAVRDRQKYLRGVSIRKVRNAIQVGDTVKLHGLRPTRYNGRIVEVVGVNRTRLVITMDGRRVTVPMSCVEAA
jgi:hypothetical protein